MSLRGFITLSLFPLLMAGAAAAATTVALPDESQTTTLQATISEQGQVSVPPAITFNVADVSVDTASAAATAVTVSGIALATATKQLRLSVKAAGATFTGSSTPFNASDIHWTGGSWTNGTGAASGGGLSTSYQEVGTCDANVASCGTADAVFSLKANTSVRHSGSQSLTMTWKFESIGT
jgi:hypothetical protein